MDSDMYGPFQISSLFVYHIRRFYGAMIRAFALIQLLALGCAMPAHAGLFGVPDQQRSGGMAAFAKWTDMLARKDNTTAEPRSGLGGSGGCVPNPRFACPGGISTSDLPAQLRSADRVTMLRSVNARLNGVRYVTDPVNWGLDDYWSTLAQFLRRDGDCEDYAIAKYMLLKQLGVPVSDMRVVIVMDQNLNIAHAILAVRAGAATYILDNQITDIVPDSSIRHYRPYYSINEQAWWVYTPPISRVEAR
jgi:predicted transglutaminase-like cysteine proteinase